MGRSRSLRTGWVGDTTGPCLSVKKDPANGSRGAMGLPAVKINSADPRASQAFVGIGLISLISVALATSATIGCWFFRHPPIPPSIEGVQISPEVCPRYSSHPRRALVQISIDAGRDLRL